MAFQLTIAEGKEAGREFVFEQTSVVIGRTSECDVVLYDPGISRRHARIFVQGSAYVVEDMGSSNGTKVNGSVVQRAELSNGDSLTLGPVVFSFALGSQELGSPIAEVSTRIVAAGGGVRRSRESALAPVGADAATLRKLATNHTAPQVPAVRRSAPAALAVDVEDVEEVEDDEVLEEAAPRALSAAERARIRRQAPGMSGSLRIWWRESSAPARNLTVLFLSLLAAGGGVGAGWFYYRDAVGPQMPPEGVLLTRAPLPSSFGHGAGVDYERVDEKAFQVEYTPPVDALLIVHFQSQDISEGEVVLFANGKDVERLPADLGDVAERANEIVVRPQYLKRGQVNQLVFDNLQNPPAADPWRIWNVWVETVPLVIKPPKQLVLDAQEIYDRGTLTFQRRDVGAGNRYRAWKDFREAWLMLEAHPDPKPELYLLARDQMRAAQQELDQRCRMLMIDFQREISHNQWDAARATLDFVKSYFPAYDQPCPFRAEELRASHGL